MRFWAEKGGMWVRCGVEMRWSRGAAAMGGDVGRCGAGIYGKPLAMAVQATRADTRAGAGQRQSRRRARGEARGGAAWVRV